MNAEIQAVIKEIRCLIVTCKNGLYLKRLWREYKETTGEYIPYRKFGFDSMPDFLRSTNQFILTSCDGDFVLMAKPTEKSAHISKLVQCQNDTKKKRSDPPRYIRSNYSSGTQQRNYGSSSTQYGNRSTRYQVQPSKPAYQNSSYSTNKSVANDKNNNNNNNYSYQSSIKPAVPFANTTNNNNYSNGYSQSAAPVSASSAKVQTTDPVQGISNDHQSTNPFLNDGRHTISMTKPTDASSSQNQEPVQRSQVEVNQRQSGTNEKSNRMANAFGINPKRNEHLFGTDRNNNMHFIVQREPSHRLAEENEKRKMAEACETTPPARENISTGAIPKSPRPIADMLDRYRLASDRSRKESLKQTMLAEQVSKLCLDTKPKVNIQSRLQLSKKSPDSIEIMPSLRRIEPEPELPVCYELCFSKFQTFFLIFCFYLSRLNCSISLNWTHVIRPLKQ